uniref:Glutathione S-transferase n=4 Tax=Viridiplantae TaxID=33090 RepID=A0A6U9QNC2_9CHLO|mmetsp:Transcript_233/g.1824  ORF Transcript_233/g.1824 Transcript_233/m.1824 type:complete len:337 (+) Transcript_233:1528-2538(+)
MAQPSTSFVSGAIFSPTSCVATPVGRKVDACIAVYACPRPICRVSLRILPWVHHGVGRWIHLPRGLDRVSHGLCNVDNTAHALFPLGARLLPHARHRTRGWAWTKRTKDICTRARRSEDMPKLTYYGLATPNGQKVSVALEEMEIAYEAKTINILKDDQFTPEFVAINPNSKIPAIVDEDGPDGKPITLFESGAILLYLAEKTGKFLPKDDVGRYKTMQWLMFQMGGIGPMFGQFGHFFKYAKDKCTDPYPKERYTNETRRLLGVLEKELSQRPYIVGDEYTIADMAIFPWVLCLSKFYQAEEHLQLHEFPKTMAWVETCMVRPAVQRGMDVCSLS